MSLLPSGFFKDSLAVIDFQQFDHNELHYLFRVFMGGGEILGSLGFWLLKIFSHYYSVFPSISRLQLRVCERTQ